MKAILFDLDGTLLDTAPDFIQAMKQLLDHERHPHPLALGKIIRQAAPHGSLAMVQAAFNLPAQNTHCEQLRTRFIHFYKNTEYQATRFYPGIEKIIDTLEQRQIPWGIVTNKLENLTHDLLKKFKLYQKAHTIVCGDTLAKAKPYPDPILHACAQLKINTTQTYFIGDAEQDLLAGRAAGTPTAIALFGYIPDLKTAKAWPADHFLNTPHDLFDLLDQILTEELQ